jgi:hypothetical protein
VRERFSAEYADAMIKLADEADRLRVQRNEIVHGAWVRMVDAQTGEYHHFRRPALDSGLLTRLLASAGPANESTCSAPSR